jgi:hypothetical protein
LGKHFSKGGQGSFCSETFYMKILYKRQNRRLVKTKLSEITTKKFCLQLEEELESLDIGAEPEKPKPKPKKLVLNLVLVYSISREY